MAAIFKLTTGKVLNIFWKRPLVPNSIMKRFKEVGQTVLDI